MTLKTYRLTVEGRTIDPLLIASMQSCRDVNAFVSQDGGIDLSSSKLVFADTAEALAPGTPIRVWLNRYFICATLVDIEAGQREHEAAQIAKEQQERDRRNAHRDEAAAFNATLALKIGVKWCPGVKEVMSGLSANSWGDGRNRASVEHVYLLEDMPVGRFKRKAGNLLCSNSKAGRNFGWSDPRSEWVDGDGKGYQPRITCRACLQIAGRLGTTAKGT